jgi:hypothetical protein
MRRFTLPTVAVLAFVAGCGGPTGSNSVEVSLESDLRDLGEMYDLYAKQVKRPPAKFDDLATVTAAPPESASDGRLTVYWGTLVSPSGGVVLAHESTADTGGGWVLMSDCKTVKKVTADEFRATPKGKR